MHFYDHTLYYNFWCPTDDYETYIYILQPFNNEHILSIYDFCVIIASLNAERNLILQVFYEV